MKFCGECGAAVAEKVPDGDDRPRQVCTRCGHVHYVNPKLVVGCIVEHEGKVLLCSRSIEPRVGFWTFPAGFHEIGESAVEGALRETREEACAEAEILGPHALLDIPSIGQSYMVFRARLQGTDFGVGKESLDTRLFALDEIPWPEIAFAVVGYALKLYVDDRQADRPRFHVGAVAMPCDGDRFDWRDYELRDYSAVPLERPA